MHAWVAVCLLAWVAGCQPLLAKHKLMGAVLCTAIGATIGCCFLLFILIAVY